MPLLRAISYFCVLLMLVSVQCRAKCVVVPHDTAKHAPECPLHKHKTPETPKCTHAPQWDVDDSKQFVATFELPTFHFIATAFVPAVTAEPVAPHTEATPPLILRI